MSKPIELCVTKTGLEQMMFGLALLGFMEARTGKSSQRSADALHMMCMWCKKYELNDMIAADKETGGTTLAERYIRRLEKLLAAYDKEINSDK